MGKLFRHAQHSYPHVSCFTCFMDAGVVSLFWCREEVVQFINEVLTIAIQRRHPFDVMGSVEGECPSAGFGERASPLLFVKVLPYGPRTVCDAVGASSGFWVIHICVVLGSCL